MVITVTPSCNQIYMHDPFFCVQMNKTASRRGDRNQHLKKKSQAKFSKLSLISRL